MPIVMAIPNVALKLKRTDSILLFLALNAETNPKSFADDSFKSLSFKSFRPAWEQTHALLLLSLAEFIFKACIWLLFCSPEGGGKWFPRNWVLDRNFPPKDERQFCEGPWGRCWLTLVH